MRYKARAGIAPEATMPKSSEYVLDNDREAFQTQHVFLVDASDFAQFFLASFALTLCSQLICEAEGA